MHSNASMCYDLEVDPPSDTAQKNAKTTELLKELTRLRKLKHEQLSM